jgi:small subunit ribosomal protein S9
MVKPKSKVVEKETKKPAKKKPLEAAPQVVHHEPVVVHHKKEHVKKERKVIEGALFATGRRKCAIARVMIVPGSGKILINGVPMAQYLSGRRVLEDKVMRPLVVTDAKTKFDVEAKVEGGGIVGQAGAVSHGIARALLSVGPDQRGKLKPEGLLTRDPRAKERKKYGRKKARKRFQFSKR